MVITSNSRQTNTNFVLTPVELRVSCTCTRYLQNTDTTKYNTWFKHTVNFSFRLLISVRPENLHLTQTTQLTLTLHLVYRISCREVDNNRSPKRIKLCEQGRPGRIVSPARIFPGAFKCFRFMAISFTRSYVISLSYHTFILFRKHFYIINMLKQEIIYIKMSVPSNKIAAACTLKTHSKK